MSHKLRRWGWDHNLQFCLVIQGLCSRNPRTARKIASLVFLHFHLGHLLTAGQWDTYLDGHFSSQEDALSRSSWVFTPFEKATSRNPTPCKTREAALRARAQGSAHLGLVILPFPHCQLLQRLRGLSWSPPL